MKHTGSIAALAAAAVALLAVPALAQKGPAPGTMYDPYDYGDEVVVIAPGVVRERTGERTSSGAHVEELTAQRVVYTGDLNLKYDGDIEELHRRVRATAIEACNDLENASRGVLLDSDRACIRDAERTARAEVDAMVYAARG